MVASASEFGATVTIAPSDACTAPPSAPSTACSACGARTRTGTRISAPEWMMVTSADPSARAVSNPSGWTLRTSELPTKYRVPVSAAVTSSKSPICTWNCLEPVLGTRVIAAG